MFFLHQLPPAKTCSRYIVYVVYQALPVGAAYPMNASHIMAKYDPMTVYLQLNAVQLPQEKSFLRESKV